MTVGPSRQRLLLLVVALLAGIAATLWAAHEIEAARQHPVTHGASDDTLTF